MTVKTVSCAALVSANRPSLFATPLAWSIAQFTRELIEEDGGIEPDRTAMIVASDECSLDTVRDIATDALRGTISPLRFAGSSPSIVVGLAALQQGLRGPTLCLTMSPLHAASAMQAMIRYWIRDNAAAAVVAITHHRHGDGHRLNGFIARADDEALTRDVSAICDRDAAS